MVDFILLTASVILIVVLFGYHGIITAAKAILCIIGAVLIILVLIGIISWVASWPIGLLLTILILILIFK